MMDTAELEAFVREFLEDVGTAVLESDGVFFVSAAPEIAKALGFPPQFALTFDPDLVDRFGAELVAPGSFALDRILALAMSRGRWDVVRVVADRGWVENVLESAGIRPPDGFLLSKVQTDEEPFHLFTFRLTLVSDEKRERFYTIVVPFSEDEGWAVAPDSLDIPIRPATVPEAVCRVDLAYEVAARALQRLAAGEIEAFRAEALTLLDEEVRRVLRYFDRTLGEIREIAPAGLSDLVGALEAERDRRLTEAVERFDARAIASLCAVRLVIVPTARVLLRLPGHSDGGVDVRLDAWTRRVRGLSCVGCGDGQGPWTWTDVGDFRCVSCSPRAAESVPPRGRPP